jgi:hypothetical protein
MDQGDVVALLGGVWDLAQTLPVRDDRMPRFAARAEPTMYRLTRRDSGGAPA